MALASKSVERVEKVVFEDKEIITLKLSREEALALVAITAKVSGTPRGPRGIIDGIREALQSEGIDYTENVFYKKLSGGVGFNGD